MQRMTPLREHMIQLLHQVGPLTASEVLLSLQEKYHVTPNKTTVYRALEYLQARGQVCTQMMRGEVMYLARADEKDYFICQRCGHTQEILLEVRPQVITQFTGGAVDHLHVTALGTCTDCQLLPQSKE